MSALFRQVPSVDTLLKNWPKRLERWGHQQLTAVIRVELDSLRGSIRKGETSEIDLESLAKRIDEKLQDNNETSLRPVFNLTGTVLHTNLGRASLPLKALEAVVKISQGPSNLEFDLSTGERGDRDSHIEALICELTGAEAATVVNNNAAAVLLVLNTLAMNKEVPVSRGELVEIGGSFRIPEVMERSNCELVEIGSTNRTHLKDYEKAINSNTALLLKVHASNYRIEGFTESVDEKELAELAHENRIPFVIDLGSGNLIDFKALGLPPEPRAAESITNGADIITFSGDKLLGGPQCGMIAGSKELIQAIKSNPLKRALRLDKMTLVALSEVLKMYRKPETLLEELPTLRQLTRSQVEVKKQAEQVLASVSKTLADDFEVNVQACNSQIGSGALPVENIPSAALVISSKAGRDEQIRNLSEKFRYLPKPVIGRISNGRLILDLRCLESSEEFVDQLSEHLDIAPIDKSSKPGKQ